MEFSSNCKSKSPFPGLLFRDLVFGYSESEQNELYIDVGTAKNVIRSDTSSLPSSESFIKSRNTYVKIPLSTSTEEPIDSFYKTASNLYSDYEDFYSGYDYDEEYDLGFPYQSIDKYQAQRTYSELREGARQGVKEEPIDQFIFPGQYVISQPHTSRSVMRRSS